MSLINAQDRSGVISALLYGTQLDTIRVYSLIMQLGFIRLGAAKSLPNEIWVSLSGNLCLAGEPSIGVNPSMDFFERRAHALGAVYQLIGKKVTAARVSDSGALQIDIGGTCILVEADQDTNLEEVWSVMSDSAETNANHRGHVSLDDSGALSAKISEN